MVNDTFSSIISHELILYSKDTNLYAKYKFNE
jgi:hypothetical protein